MILFFTFVVQVKKCVMTCSQVQHVLLSSLLTFYFFVVVVVIKTAAFYLKVSTVSLFCLHVNCRELVMENRKILVRAKYISFTFIYHVHY